MDLKFVTRDINFSNVEEVRAAAKQREK